MALKCLNFASASATSAWTARAAACAFAIGVLIASRPVIAQPAATPPPDQSESTKPTPPKAAPSKAFKQLEPSQFSQPLLFAPEDNNIDLMSPQIKWDMDKGRINLGGIVIDSTQIAFHLTQNKRDDTPYRYREFGRGTETTTNFSLAWPDVFLKEGVLEVLDRQSKVIWSERPDEIKRDRWRRQIDSDDDGYLKAHKGSPYGVVDADLKAYGFLKDGMVIRLCVRETRSQQEKIRICTGLYRVAVKGEAIRLLQNKTAQAETVFIGGTEIGNRGIVNFPEGKSIDMRIHFDNGAMIEFFSRPLELKLLDVVTSKEGDRVLLMGQGLKPVGEVKDLVIPPTHFWSRTGVKEEIIWQVAIPRDAPTLKVLGAWNVPFTYLVKFEDLPSEDDRIYAHTKTPSGTYVDGASIYAYSPAGDRVASKEKSVKRSSKTQFLWQFQAKDRGQMNRSRLLVAKSDGSKKKWTAHYQMFKGYPFELSARLTGIVDANLQTVLIAEGAGSVWFERVLGSDNHFLSRQRWGLTARYLQAMTAFIVNPEEPENSSFSVGNVDLKYNVIPGLWNRDELLGVMASLETIELGGTTATLYGGGLYWARTMPRIFDDLFNILPMFRFPKYVDMEFVYYPFALTSHTIAGNSYNLNFHGKVFWTQRFFGEAGFGLKQFNYTDLNKEIEVPISTAYGTVGLGFIF